MHPILQQTSKQICAWLWFFHSLAKKIAAANRPFDAADYSRMHINTPIAIHENQKISNLSNRASFAFMCTVHRLNLVFEFNSSVGGNQYFRLVYKFVIFVTFSQNLPLHRVRSSVKIHLGPQDLKVAVKLQSYQSARNSISPQNNVLNCSFILYNVHVF